VVLESVVDVKGTRLTVLNVHLSTAAGPRSLTRRPSALAAYLSHTAAVRSEQISALLRIADAPAPPVLLAGDFNTPPRGLLYRRLGGRFQDAFRVAGWSLGHTYPTQRPLMRIDYVFAGEGIAVRGCATLTVAASDHRPVIADVGI
jgi:vancomycin resistance protein VanJ